MVTVRSSRIWERTRLTMSSEMRVAQLFSAATRQASNRPLSPVGTRKMSKVERTIGGSVLLG